MTQDTRYATPRPARHEPRTAEENRERQLTALAGRQAARGHADAAATVSRSRFMQLLGPRPLAFTQLLFLPFDPLIMSPSEWQPGAVGITRAALVPLAGVVQAAMGARAIAVSALIEGHSTEEPAVVAEVGAMLWPDAAEVLRTASAPENWAEMSGLHPGDFVPLATSVAALLAHGDALWRLADRRFDHFEPKAYEELLRAAIAAGPQPLADMLALLLTRLPHAGNLLQVADDLAARATDAARLAPDRAIDFLLVLIEEAPNGFTAATQNVDEVRRAALLLDSLLGPSQRRPTRVARLDRVRRHLDEGCRAAFDTAAAGFQPGAADARVVDMEFLARLLRRMEAVGRRLGSAASYSTALRDAAERLRAADPFSHVARLRLAEILLGPDAALAMFGMP